MARKVARIGLHYAQDRGTHVWVYNIHQADCTMFLDGSLEIVLAYARGQGSTHYSPHRAYDYRTAEEQREADNMGYAWEPMLAI